MAGFSLFTDLITPTKYKVPDAPQIDAAQEQLNAIQGNTASFATAKGLADDFNNYMREQVSKSLRSGVPGFEGLSTQLAQNLASQLRGELTTSDVAAAQREGVGKALGLGIAGSPAGAALTARNLGLRQYQVQQGAQAQTPGYLSTMAGLTRAPMFDFSNVFMSPQQRISSSMWNQENRWNVQNLRNQMSAQPDPWMKALAGFGDSLLTAAGSYFTGGIGGMTAGGNTGGSFWSNNFASPTYNAGDEAAAIRYGIRG